jgi:hypothetical protein
LLSTLAQRPPGGQRVRDTVAAITTAQIADDLTLRAEAFVEFIDGDHESRSRRWNSSSRQLLRDFLAVEAAELAARPDDRWDGVTPRWDQTRLSKVYPELSPPPPTPETPPPAEDVVAAAAAAAPAPAS